MKATIAIGKETHLSRISWPVEIRKDTYKPSGNLALIADEPQGEQFCVLSVNLPELSDRLPKNQCFIKTWSENEGFLDQIVGQKVVKRTGTVDRNTGAVLVEVLF